MIKGPNFEPGATARRSGNPKATGGGRPISRFSCYKSPRGQGTGSGPTNRLGLIPRRGSRCTSPPDAPLAWPAARPAERRGCPPTSRPKHIPCPPQPGVSNESNLRVVIGPEVPRFFRRPDWTRNPLLLGRQPACRPPGNDIRTGQGRDGDT